MKGVYAVKRILFRTLAVCLALIFTAASALAAAPATPNQRLSFRTGPGTKYVEWYTLPQNTEITAIEYESSSVTWVLVEFMYNGERVQAYTGLKRMTVHGDIPWADHLYQPVSCIAESLIYAAPTGDAAVRGALAFSDSATLLRTEGSYAFIEYTDAVSGMPSRGWVPTWALDIGSVPGGDWIFQSPIQTGNVSIGMYVDLAAPMYDQPEYANTAKIIIPQYAQVQCFGHLYCGFSIVEYAGCVGYVPSHFLSTYE